MRRLAGNILFGLSVTLALALIWCGTFGRQSVHGIRLETADVVLISTKPMPTPHHYYLNVRGGKLIAGHWRYPPFTERLADERELEMQVLDMEREKRAILVQRMRVLPGYRQQGIQDLDESDARITRRRKALYETYRMSPGFHLGFRDGVHTTPFQKIPHFMGVSYDSYPSWSPPSVGFRLVVPVWYMLPLLLIAPAVRGRRSWQTWRRRRSGQCAKCGYDMRATPEMCPECGTGLAMGRA
jgi:hypothetical protein